MESRKTVFLYMDKREMRTGKTVFLYMDKGENRPDQISYPNKGGPHYGSNFTCWCCCY